MFGVKKRMVNPGRRMVGLTLFLLLWLAVAKDLKASDRSIGTALMESVTAAFTDSLYDQYLPAVSLAHGEKGVGWFLQGGMENIMPLYGAARQEIYVVGAGTGTKSRVDEKKDGEKATTIRFQDLDDLVEEAGRQGEVEAGAPREQTGNVLRLPEEETDLQELLRTENESVMGMNGFETRNKKMEVNLEEYAEYEALVKTFYTIDANTAAGSELLDINKLTEKDMRIDRGVEGPQILIYHTHSKEAFADSDAEDDMTGIMGVGEYLAELLRERYGYRVMHHMGQYDAESRDNAYGNALPDLERILAENPSIQVVIDLHRDQMPEDTKLVMNVDGRPTARFMFFNGLSRTRKTGDIAYLRNENLEDNLAFSFQMQLAAQEYYPGITRKIYLKGYRYNMHVCPKTLLIELGAQNNTVEEAMNACDPLAHVLDLVIGGGS